MAVTYRFLDAVNASMKRCRFVQGDAGNLVTSTVTSTATGLVATEAFTDSSRQSEIDITLQVWNEAFHEIYGMGMLAPECGTATFALVAAQREYTFPTDFQRIAGESYETRALRGATRQWVIKEYPGGYGKMLVDQAGLASQWQGEPQYFAFSPVSIDTIRFDREPTTNEAGWTYNSLYEKRILRSSTMATEAMPFNDTVTDSLVPVVAEWVMRVFKKDFDAAQFRGSLARALEYLTQNQPRKNYGPSTGWY